MKLIILAFGLGLTHLFVSIASARAEDRIYTHALAYDDCAPWDGPALSIQFYASDAHCDSEAEPLFNVKLWRSPLEQGMTIHLTDQGADHDHTDPAGFTGVASKKTKKNVIGWESAKPAAITLDVLNSTEVRGSIDLSFPDGAEKGTFSAKKCPRSALCG